MHTALMSTMDWAVTEFGGAELGDQRRTRRLAQVAARLADDPHGTLPQTFSIWSELKAAYRLLEEPDVTREAIAAPHIQRVRQACRPPGDYLFVEDTTSLDFTSHPAARDLGPIDNRRRRGLYTHSTLAMQIDAWDEHNNPQVTIAGVAAQHCWVRPERKRTDGPLESDRWAALIAEIGPPPEPARYTFVADRESDIFETIRRCRSQQWDFVIRANQARAMVDQDGSIFDAVAAAPVLGRFHIALRSRPKRVRRHKKTGKPKRTRKAHGPRTAVLEVRTCTVRVRPPKALGASAEPSTLHLVEAREVNAAAGDDPIHWVLLTSWPCGGMRDAIRVVKAYARRWLIEEYHKALKTGTGIEASQLATADRLLALLGILAVVAARLLNRKLLATTRPDDRTAAEDLGETALRILAASFGCPTEGWTNRTVLRSIARLGGFLARKNDGEPGWITIWRGWQRLLLMMQGFLLAEGEKCG